ncbi:hypothetical protein QJQ45_004730 [Haematococcus lacustris]|nr:hypothetical protein QJQ45_004730 [Haematococcus lacustris]
MLRHYILPTQVDWPRHLAFAEFAINNSWQESIQSTPFLVNYGQSPITPMLHKLPRPCLSPSAESFAKKWEHEVKHAQECMRVAQDRQERYENKRRRDVTFSVGDSVLLSTKNLRNAPGKARKFLPRQVRFKKRMEYLVKWTGYDDTYNTWEPEANLAGAPQILSSVDRPLELSLWPDWSPLCCSGTKTSEAGSKPLSDRLYKVQEREQRAWEGTDQLRGRVVLVDEHRTTRVSSGVNGQQPCEEELDHNWLRQSKSQGPALSRNIGESRELCWWPEQGALPAKGKEYPGLGYKRVRDKPPKAQQQQPAEAQQCVPPLS